MLSTSSPAELPDLPFHVETPNASRGSCIADPRVVAISQALAPIGSNSLGGICCYIEGATVILTGIVDSYYSKQRAQEALRSMRLPLSIDNRCVVKTSSMSSRLD